MPLNKFKDAYLESCGCVDCGWMAGWWELDDEDFEPTNHPTRLNEYRAMCTSQNDPDDNCTHDGYYIYFVELSA